jgi:hypothetical protein
MPIAVRCANPTCDKVHHIKDKYAGMRGRCPACANWMIVPRPGPAPAPRVEPAPSTAPEKLSAAPGRHFSTWALALLFLSALCAGSVSAVPYLEQPAVAATGDLQTTALGSLHLGVRQEAVPLVVGVPAAAAGLLVLTLLITLARRRFDVLSLGPAYLALLVAWALLVLGGFIFRDHLNLVNQLHQQAYTFLSQAPGRAGSLTVHWGAALFVGLAGAVGAFSLSVVALLRMHRSVAGRVLCATLVLFLLAGGGAVLFAAELGLDRVQIVL